MLLKKIIERQPNFKRPDMSKWQEEVRQAILADGRTERELLGCIEWVFSNNDGFWRKIIINTRKLREKFDSMEAQMQNESKNTTRERTISILMEGGYLDEE